MIIGIGSDFVTVARIKKLLLKKKDSFLKKILTATEITALNKITNQEKIPGYVANRFAAKEAFAKALGTGIGKVVSFQDLTIAKTITGKPYVIFSAKLNKYILETYGNDVVSHLTMSNEKEHSQAFVVIEKLV